jgi:two-component system response regulator YesN
MRRILTVRFGTIETAVRVETDPTRAVEIAREWRPNLCFVDMRMPGLSGVEFIESCQSVGLNTDFVVLSAHHDFEFVKQAFKLGIKDYLLKPVNESALVDIVTRVRSDQADRYIEHHFLQSDEFLGALRTRAPGWRREAERLVGGGSPHWEEPIRTAVLRLGLAPGLGTLTATVRELRTRSSPSRVIHVGHDSIRHLEIISGSTADDLAEAVSVLARQRRLPAAVLAIGPTARSSDELAKSLTVAYENLLVRFYPEHRQKPAPGLVVVPGAIPAAAESPPESSLVSRVHEILWRSGTGELESALIDLDDVLSRLEAEPRPDELRWLLREVQQAASGRSLANAIRVTGGSLPDLNKPLEEFDSMEDLGVYLKEAIIASGSDPSETQSPFSAIDLARQYIHDNFTRDISLEDVARHVSMSYSHFSRTFKADVGVPFLEYLTRLRMTTALELLRDPRLLVQDVARGVGYSSGKQFTRQFRRQFGASPAEYRRQRAEE